MATRSERVTKSELLATLEIRRQGRAPQPPPKSKGVQRWRDADGNVFGLGWTAAGEHWIHLLGVGTYSFVPGGDRVTVVAEASVGEEWIVDAFERTVLPMALHVSGQQVLHSSAVLFPMGVVGFCAYGGTGKSTIAHALSRRGHQLVADDALAFTVDDEGVGVRPLPFSLRQLQDSAERPSVLAPVHTSDDHRRLRLAALLVLARDRRLRSTPRIARLVPSGALAALVPHAYRFTSRDVERKRKMMTTYLELVDRVPVLSVRFRPGFDHLRPLLDHIERAVDEHVGAAT